MTTNGLVTRCGSVMALLAAAPALAQDVDPHTGIVVQTFPWAVFTCSDPAYTWETECEEMDATVGEFQNHVVAVYATREGGWPEGIGGIQFGIEYAFENGQVTSWTLCSGGSEVPEAGWPASGTGNAVTWMAGCHVPPGEVAFVGAFLVYTESFGEPVTGWLRITADPRVGQALVADCETNLAEVCSDALVTWTAGESLPDVCGACIATPTRSTSWGELKRGFETAPRASR